MIVVGLRLFGIQRPVVELVIDGTDDLAEELAALVEREEAASPSTEGEA